MNNTKITYKYNLSSTDKGSDIINKKAQEQNCRIRDKHAIFCRQEGDQTFTDADGYEHTTGHRIDIETGKTIKFHIVNSFKKDQNHQEQKALNINND